MKVIHVLDHSLPYVTEYSLKSRYIIKLQKDLGLKPTAITSPFHGTISNPIELIDGVFHYRSILPLKDRAKQSQCPLCSQGSMISALSQAIQRVIEHQQIDLIHAHSPVFNGFAALEASRASGIPLIYEIRKSGEEKVLHPDKKAHHPIPCELKDKLEIILCQEAGAVVTSEEQVREKMIHSGLAAEKIFSLPQADENALLQPMQKDRDLVAKYHLEQSPVLGFIGSFFQSEGVDCLLQAFLKIHQQVPEAKLLVLDEGERKKELNPAYRDFSGHIIYIGQAKHKDIKRYYSLIDILVYPKLEKNADGDIPSCQQLEAMTMPKPAGPIDPSGLRELVVDKKAGLFFTSNDISDLAGKCLKVMMNKQFRQTIDCCHSPLHQQARTWLHVLAQYLKVYRSVLTH